MIAYLVFTIQGKSFEEFKTHQIFQICLYLRVLRLTQRARIKKSFDDLIWFLKEIFMQDSLKIENWYTLFDTMNTFILLVHLFSCITIYMRISDLYDVQGETVTIFDYGAIDN